MEIGARGLRSVMEKIMTNIMYEVPSDNKIEKVILTRESVVDNEPPNIVRRPKPQIDPDAVNAS
jgi:ATP-dependent Clp protease ATP-binding subunit ClpX